MTALGVLFSSIFGTLFAWIGTYLTKRSANYVAFAVTIAAAVAALWVVINGLIAGIVVATPEELTQAVRWFAPSNLDECLAARVGAEIAIAGYRYHKDTVRASAAVV